MKSLVRLGTFLITLKSVAIQILCVSVVQTKDWQLNASYNSIQDIILNTTQHLGLMSQIARKRKPKNLDKIPHSLKREFGIVSTS